MSAFSAAASDEDGDEIKRMTAIAEDLQDLCDRQSLRIAELESMLAAAPQPRTEQEPVICEYCENERPVIYAPQPPRQPLTEEQITQICVKLWSGGWREKAMQDFARAIERAHGIGGEE